MTEIQNACKGLQKDIEHAIKNMSDTQLAANNQILKNITPIKTKPNSNIRQTIDSREKPQEKNEKSYLKSKDTMQLNTIKQSPNLLSRLIWKEFDLNISEEKRKKFSNALRLIQNYENSIKNDELRKASLILEDLSDIEIEKSKGVKFLNKINFPEDIKEFMDADIDEVEKTLNAGCYRSSIIICGRLLETALHRKFFEKTGTDILEKHPEIGLGKIIAKLEELNVQMPPGLTQQIHLINQARIHSVHKKKEAFLPSREQAYAVILFTVDVLKKLF